MKAERSVDPPTAKVLGGPVYWLSLLAGAVAAIVAIDAILLALGSGYFGKGFNSTGNQTLGTLATYFVSAAALDTCLVLVSWLIARPVMLRLAGGPFRGAALALVFATAPAILAAVVSYRIHRTLGNIVGLSLLAGSSVGVSSSSAGLFHDLVTRSDWIILALLVLSTILAPLLAWRIDRWRRAKAIRIPSLRVNVTAAAVALAAGILASAILSSGDGLVLDGIERKASFRALASVLRFTTDWDRDGFGWLSRPADPAPFEASRRPYAIEIPGNGIDENGIGGDLPPDRASLASPTIATEVGPERPHLLLVFLESFRPDFIGRKLDGKIILPNLAALAKRGVSSEQAFDHSPWTIAARRHLFMGNLVDDSGKPTLVDDLKERGYFVAHFSGQDDSYGDAVRALGFERAQVFYDARQDVDRRTSRSAVPVSLQISWKTLLERALGFLEDYDRTRPLAMYVNIVDTHFPYTHREIDPIFESADLDRGDIAVDQADRIVRAYLNTAANVDRAIGRLIEAWDRRVGSERNVILVLGDHAEAFYERGSLGHGQSLAAIESRIPFIAVGLGGQWKEPIAISEIRAQLARYLHRRRMDAPLELQRDPTKRILQYLGKLDEPQRIAHRGIESTVVLDLASGASWKLDRHDVRMPDAPTRAEINELVWEWERLQAARRSRHGVTQDTTSETGSHPDH